jgi:transposase
LLDNCSKLLSAIPSRKRFGFAVVAKMILHAAEGMPNDEIAACLDTRREVVSIWRKRFFADRLSGLEERARPGRPRTFSPRPRRAD